MKYGFKENKDLLICANCNSVVGKNEKLLCNFCPKCGNPISIDAINLRGNEYTEQRIKLIYEIKQDVENGNDINKILEDYIKSINED